MSQRNKYSNEVKERAVRMVYEAIDSHGSKWAAIKSIAPKIGCAEQTLDKWLKQDEIDIGTRPGETTNSKARIKELEREVKELSQANEILRKASAFFAQAELDRPRRK